MSISRKYKLLSARTRLLKNELELVDETIKAAEKEFILILATRHTARDDFSSPSQSQVKKTPQPKEAPQPSHPNSAAQNEETRLNRKPIPENLKKAYKKIAFASHPDKLVGVPEYEASHKKSLFEKAKKALEEMDYCGIIEVAVELGIKPPLLSRVEVEMIKSKIKKLEKKIKEKKESISWVWYHARAEEKEAIMDRYIEKLEELNTRS